MVRWLVTLSFAALASFVAWVWAGRALEERARDAAANAWVDAELCLVGPGLGSGARPSARLRTIALGPDATRGWPKRCNDVARTLDDALKAPPLRATFSRAPSLAASLAISPTERDANVDRLWGLLREASLPAGTPSYKGVAPEPTVVSLKRAGLEVLASGFSLDALAFDWSSADGAVRFLLPGDDPRWCRVALDAPQPEIHCLALGERLPNPPRMPWTEANAPEFLFGRVGGRAGFFDAAAGARIWSPPTEEAEAIVRASGEATVLQSEAGEEDSDPNHWRLVQLVPGKPQVSRRIELPAGSKALLFPEGIAWWQPEVDAKTLYFAGLERARVSRRHTIGTWDPPSKIATHCALGAAHALVLEGKAARSLLTFAGKSARLDALPKDGELSCYGGALRVLRGARRRLDVRRCDARGCRDESSLGPAEESAVAVMVGDERVAIVLDSGGVGRAFVVTPKGLVPNPHVLFEDASAGGLDVRAMRAVGGEKRGLVFVEDDERRIYALAIDRAGEPAALVTRSW